MANEEHMKIIWKGSGIWNEWRKKHPKIIPDLRHADFSYANLSYADLSSADLSYANLSYADLRHASFKDTHLSYAHLSYARLMNADFSYADLNDANLEGDRFMNAHLAHLSNPSFWDTHFDSVNFRGANLRNANFSYANLSSSNFSDANLSDANLRRTNLNDADLRGIRLMKADLSSSNLREADLRNSNLRGADLRGADLTKAIVAWTIFGDLDLRNVTGLENIEHTGPSTIGMDTITRSEGDIPVSFLKGAGVSDGLIEYAKSLIGRAIDYYTCFISYSSQDDAFAERLYADLQNEGVRCWFAPHDMKIGDKIRPRIDESIRLYDKLLLVLSKHSIDSQWVEHEVEMALAKEQNTKQMVLFPIRLDKAIMEMSQDGWPSEVRHTRHIGNFEHWKDHDKYQVAFTRLLLDLQARSALKGVNSLDHEKESKQTSVAASVSTPPRGTQHGNEKAISPSGRSSSRKKRDP
ncbi:hypothetical protein KSF_049520 [Reticulibacter mediterranei]|uniref:TIR domain-containing protein n=1 Tax=Reticulibacter mediterranei TaxID=2778369 RepID=A0A8J3IG86_9CHLR|nr:toll/interleukin-1 receptor domain-containing protein [Reticulibacter mediterranei]GHO94904.1 hypothetical protein KSF_049520 [Reticulibacter mediterranei]